MPLLARLLLLWSHLTHVAVADKQGYTPYGYGVDVPVIVRTTTSYGRGWQLLRSRGENLTHHGTSRETDVKCDPPQLASSCTHCARAVGDDAMPRCMPSAACGTSKPPPQTAHPLRATILFVVDANASNLRFYFGRAWRKAYTSQISLLARAVVSLRRVNTTLPIHVLVSGERIPAVEARLISDLGVGVLGPEHAPPVHVPTWGSKWARGSFAKLRAISLGQKFERVVLLDADTMVLRNIDHLASLPAPAFVAGYKCFPRAELRAAVAVLEPSAADWQRALQLMHEPSTAIYDDLGEGCVWRHLYRSVHELPIGYGALRTSDLPATEWGEVHVLHDPNLLRKASRAGWKESGMAERVKLLDAAQAAALTPFKEAFAAQSERERAAPREPVNQKLKKRGKRGLRRGRVRV